MVSVQGGSGGGNNNNNNPNNDLAIVYRAVASGASAEQVRSILSGGPRTRRARNAWLAADLEYKNPADGETALACAHCRRDGRLVGLLLEHGADARALGPNANPLAICIAYGQADSLKVLLQSGRHSADEEVGYFVGTAVTGDSQGRSQPAHLCVVPPPIFEGPYDRPPPQLECLRILVRDFGANVNARDELDCAPLHWLQYVSPAHARRAFDALIALGADVNARNLEGQTPIFAVASQGDPGMLRQILALGASPDVITETGYTPLICAALHQRRRGVPVAGRRETILALVRASSVDTRRAVWIGLHSTSALDRLLFCAGGNPAPHPLLQQAIDELLSSRAPVHPFNTRRALPFAARLAERRAAEAAKRNRSGAMQWRAHEDLFGLAQDFQELREAEERVEARERRVAELEEALRRRGIGEEEGDDETSGEGAVAAAAGLDEEEDGAAAATSK